MAHLPVLPYTPGGYTTSDTALYAALAGGAHVIRHYQRKVLAVIGLVLAVVMVGYVLVRLLARRRGFDRE